MYRNNKNRLRWLTLFFYPLPCLFLPALLCFLALARRLLFLAVCINEISNDLWFQLNWSIIWHQPVTISPHHCCKRLLCLISCLHKGFMVPAPLPHTHTFISFFLSTQGTERGFYGNEEETTVSFSAESLSCQRGRERWNTSTSRM